MYALLSDEQVALRDAVDALARSVGVHNPVDLEDRTPAQGWSALEQMGLLELRRRDGDRPTGSGVEVMVTAQSLAAGLVPVPFLPSAVLATELMAIGAAPEDWLDQSMSVDESYGILLSPDLRDLASTDALDGAVVWGATTAQYALATTPTDDGPRLSRLRLAEAPAANASVDLTQGVWPIAATSGVESAGLIERDRLSSWRALAMSGVCADLVGVMRAALDGAVAYSKQRIAYGQPIGSFQAIQHMAAETHVAIEAAYGATCYAAWCVDEVDAETALLAARTAKAYCASVARTATENVMQIYGGVGQTWEHIAHFYTRRALLGTQLFGDEAAQLDEIARTRLGGI
jgi:hypothetical protein